MMTDILSLKAACVANHRHILESLLSGGKYEGNSYVVRNPNRNDSHAGSFKVDVATGRFNDFATGDKGVDYIDLAKFCRNCNTCTAIQKLKNLLQMEDFSLTGSISSSSYKEKPVSKKALDPSFIWNKSVKAGHEYLSRKKVSIGNCRVNEYREEKRLIVPLVESFSDYEYGLQIKTLQFIKEAKDVRESERDKYFLKGIPTKSLFYIASDYGRSKDVIVIAESFSDAQSIADATDLCVVSCMGCENMRNIALKIRELLPNSRIVIAANNDEPGLKAANKALQVLAHPMTRKH